MTSEHKDRIAEIRRQGCTYAKIAQTISISENTLKTYCRQARLAKDA
jgi:DNA-binding CsgD family transcriptional regulator